MNKTHVIEHLRFALEAQLHNAKEAAKAAHDAATHEESVAETQYDTLGLEAAYLAQGQLSESMSAIVTFKHLIQCLKKANLIRFAKVH